MEVMYVRCAGLDVHKKTVVACVRIAAGPTVHREVRTFATSTRALGALRAWLTSAGVTQVAMEATGVYWKPVWHLLAGSFGLVLANPAHVKAVPGRKTDVNDATWLADLLAHGLIRGSFVPEPAVRELRDLSRTRKQCVRERSRHVQRLQKVLQDANLKLDSVLTDLTGKSGRTILRALIAGETSADALAQLGDVRLKATAAELADACCGFVTAHHRFLLKLELDEVEHIETVIAQLGDRARALVEPLQTAVDLVRTAPGFDTIAATAVVAEIGADMSPFPTDGNLVSWACLCPRSDETAGKRRSTRTRRGAPWLKPVLIQAAWSAVRVKDSYERALFFWLRARSGSQKAIVAVAASLLTAIYHMLRKRTPYQSLGPDHFAQLDRDRTRRRLVRRLESLGYTVDVKDAA